jgi:hypothetical protein
MTGIAQLLGDAMVCSYTFKFIVPTEAERLKMPNSWTTCHTDKPTAWATEALRTWPEFWAWRSGLVVCGFCSWPNADDRGNAGCQEESGP